jgi:hypothetical protein
MPIRLSILRRGAKLRYSSATTPKLWSISNKFARSSFVTIRRLRAQTVSLALAAYNAGPAPVARCGCVPSCPETRAYVARVLGLMGGAGELLPGALGMEVRLVA